MIVYIDTNTLVYSLTGKPEFKNPARNWLDRVANPGTVFVTSRLTILEALIGPLRKNDMERLNQIEAALNSLKLLEVDDGTIRHAASIRATHSFRTPDALHLASAVISHSELFLTGDRRLKSFPGIAVADVLRDHPETFLTRR